MEKTGSLERGISDTDFTLLVTEIIDNTKQLAGTVKDNPDYVIFNISKGESIVIHINYINTSVHESEEIEFCQQLVNF